MPDAADRLLAELLDRVSELPMRDFDALDAVSQRADMALRRAFGEDSVYRSRLSRIHFSPMVAPTPEESKIRSWNSGVAELRNLLETGIEERALFAVDGPSEIQGAQPTEYAPGDKPTVFVVHGHGELTKETVARFLEKLGCNAVILHDQANKGRTIIEKFEQESAPAAYAVVLLTADDIGGAVGGEQQKRARQNVVFELGYFVGTLRRAKVAALLESDVEVPGDYDGVVWIGLNGHWRLELAKEMKAAGLPIDLNDAV